MIKLKSGTYWNISFDETKKIYILYSDDYSKEIIKSKNSCYINSIFVDKENKYRILYKAVSQ